MSTFRIPDQRLSEKRRREVVAEAVRDRGVGYASGGLERVCANIEDPLERFIFVQSVRDAPDLFAAVRIISERDSALRAARHRRPADNCYG